MKEHDQTKDAAALLQLLDEQAALFEQWLEADRNKRNALVDQDREQLEASVVRQTQLLIDLDATEKKRRAAIAKSFPGQGDLSLRQVAESVSTDMRELYLECEVKLKTLFELVRESSEQSDVLLRQASAHNQLLLDALLGDEGVPPTYGPQGVVTGTPAGGVAKSSQARRINRQA